jgi:hypothetical protein
MTTVSFKSRKTQPVSKALAIRRCACMRSQALGTVKRRAVVVSFIGLFFGRTSPSDGPDGPAFSTKT